MEMEQNNFSPKVEIVVSDVNVQFNKNIKVKVEEFCDDSFQDNISIFGMNIKSEFNQQLPEVKLECQLETEEPALANPEIHARSDYRTCDNKIDKLITEFVADRHIKTEASEFSLENCTVNLDILKRINIDHSYAVTDENFQFNLNSAEDQRMKIEIEECELDNHLITLIKSEHDQTPEDDFNGNKPDDANGSRGILIPARPATSDDTACSCPACRPDMSNKRSKHEVTKCFFCDYSTQWKSHLKSHVMHKHSEMKPLACHLCEYICVRKSQLQSHVMCKHDKLKPFKCNFCNYSSAWKSTLHRHVISKHSDLERLKRHLCNYACAQECQLNVTSKHGDYKPYKCQVCDYGSVWKRQLKLHVTSTHGELKPYKCESCSYAFVRKRGLEMHVFSKHSESKPLNCHLCSYTCVRDNQLKVHLISKHSNNRPFKCGMCYYAGVQKQHLKAHILSQHSELKPHKCHLCDYTTVQKKFLELHVMSKHDKLRPFKCHLCSYKTVWDGYLQSHILRKHMPSTCHLP